MMRLVDVLGAQQEIAVACPSRTPMADAAETCGVALYRLPPVDASLRLDPVWTPIGLSQLALGGLAVRRAARRFGADVIHANSVRAGLLGAIASGRGPRRMVVQVHENLPVTRIGRIIRSVIAASSAGVIGVSDHTAENFDQGLPQPVAKRVYISIDLHRFRPSASSHAAIRDELQLRSNTMLLGEIAQITPWKAQDTAIRMLAELLRLGIAAHLLIIGHIAFAGRGVRYDNRAYLQDLHGLVERLRLHDRVHFLGWRDDIPELLSGLDLSLLPSYDEPFGISVAESMASGTPVMVSAGSGASELIIDRKSGRVLPSGEPEIWAQAAHELLSDHSALTRMAENAIQAVAHLTDKNYTREMLEVYETAARNAERGLPSRAPRRVSRRPATTVR